jgi:hypothetical protein
MPWFGKESPDMQHVAATKPLIERTPRPRTMPFGMLVASIARAARDDHETARTLNDLFASGGLRFTSPSHTSLLAFFEARP